MISPWLAGATDPQWVLTLVDNTGAEVNLSGISPSNCALMFRNQRTGQETPGAGSFVITTAASGIITYTLAAGDVATAGTYDLSLAIQMTDGRTRKWRYPNWQLLPA